jgi:uncharacterized repeat protein (TIGR03803 family)
MIYPVTKQTIHAKNPLQVPRSSHPDSRARNRRWRYAAAGTAAALALFLSPAPGLHAQTFTSLYSFQGSPDGANPAGALAEDSSGNIYGTTYGGGAGQGTVFTINSSGRESLCHTFAGNPDGAFPNGSLITNPAGSVLYGTTQSGGSINAGSVFQLALPCSGAETVLYNFNYSVDGYFPQAGVILGASGDLYGTTENGGTQGNGTVFAIDPASQFEVSPFPVALTDGAYPYAGLVQDQNGNLFGDTTFGGANNLGTIFEVSTSGQVTTLYSFSGQSDGAYPYGTLIIDSKGNLYGTTNGGGANGLGVVFEYSPSSPGLVTTLHPFAGIASGDGANSIGGLVMDSAGNLYGVTQVGGTACANSSNGCGTIFEIDASGNETILHSFNGSDGYLPYANLILDAKTNILYGTTNQGGSANLGTVFKYALPSPIPPLTVTAKLAASSSGFELQAFVTQSGGPAINPSTQGMTLAIGSPQIYSVTIPAASFNTANKGWYTFNGTINGVSIQCRVSQQGTNLYEVQLQASGVNITSQHNPPVTLTFGPNTGSTQTNQPATINTSQAKPKH